MFRDYILSFRTCFYNKHANYMIWTNFWYIKILLHLLNGSMFFINMKLKKCRNSWHHDVKRKSNQRQKVKITQIISDLPVNIQSDSMHWLPSASLQSQHAGKFTNSPINSCFSSTKTFLRQPKKYVPFFHTIQKNIFKLIRHQVVNIKVYDLLSSVIQSRFTDVYAICKRKKTSFYVQWEKKMSKTSLKKKRSKPSFICVINNKHK